VEFTDPWGGVAFVLVVVAAALALGALAQRLFPADVLRDGHDASGGVLAIVGTLYAVLLGLVVVDAMVRFEQAIDVTQQESNCLANIFLLAERFPEPERSRVRDRCRNYAAQVADEEWRLMQTARMSVNARSTALAITTSLDTFEPVSEAHKIVYPLMLEQMRDLWDKRRDRANTVRYGIPAVEWVALLIGGAVTVFLAGLFSVGSSLLRWLLTGLLGLVIGLNLYLVSLFGYPFAGGLSVSNRPFLLDIGIFESNFEVRPDEPRAAGSTTR